ncbi:MAG: hypothetical protein KC418_17205, partial [Anaerolineales bacterium]|nr:hypothetical protein [Anaerolineales bacterium]
DLLRAPTPTLDPFHLPLSSPTPVRSTPRPVNTPTPPLVPTVTLPEDALQALATVASNPVATRPSDTNDGTPAPPDTTAATPEPVANCPENVNLSAPNAGSAISGLVPFSGTATAANFSFYKLEINGPQTDNTWASLLGRTISQPVFAGLLGSGNFNGWLPGAYRVRLIVVDATGNEQGSCTVDININ